VLLFVAPLAVIAAFSFGTVDIVGRPHLGLTLDNYRQATQSYYVPVILRTLWLSVATTLICLLFGYPVAYLAARLSRRVGTAVIAILILTWLVDYLVRIYAWITILDDGGLVNRMLVFFHAHAIHFLPSTFAVLCGLVYGYYPLMVVPIYASLQGLDSAVIEAGKDLYGTPRQTFWWVTLRYSLPGVVGGMVLTFFPMLGDFATAQFLGGPNQTMIGNVIAAQYFSQGGSVTFAAALTMFLIGTLILGVAIIARVSRAALPGSGLRVAAAEA
jgi:spermidine/putrescine transport system permease protein